jgi:hypothetical protein
MDYVSENSLDAAIMGYPRWLAWACEQEKKLRRITHFQAITWGRQVLDAWQSSSPVDRVRIQYDVMERAGAPAEVLGELSWEELRLRRTIGVVWDGQTFSVIDGPRIVWSELGDATIEPAEPNIEPAEPKPWHHRDVDIE